MFPKEHGAYGQLLFPIATAFVIGHFSWSAAALALAAVCTFIAHEPLLVLLGQRGPRAQRELRGRAWRWLAAWGSAAAGAAIAALVLLPATARAPLAAAVALGAGLASFIATGREHTLAGESWMSVTMGAFGAPLAVAADAPLRDALTLAVAFAGAFVAPTVAVHAVIAFTRRPPALRSRLISVAVTLAVAIAVAIVVLSASVGPAALQAIAPACGVALVLALRPPAARRLRVVGWTLVATSAAAAAILIANL
jgi:hypothetical protein